MSNGLTSVVIVDNDKSLQLESDSFFRKLINLFFIPILNNLPSNFREYIKKSNAAAAKVLENVTNHDALEVLYSKGNSISRKKGWATRFFQYVWFNLENSKAVRNRLKIVIREIHDHLEKIASFDREINIISIASGSSRSIVDVVKSSNYLEGTKLSITFLDKNPKAIEYSKSLCKDLNVYGLNWINDTVGNYMRGSEPNKFDIVEIVGLFDYFSNEKVEETLRGIYNILQEGGIVITANIHDNKERRFITEVVGWPMIYRSAEDLRELACKAGFSANKIRTMYEPLKIHSIVVARK